LLEILLLIPLTGRVDYRLITQITRGVPDQALRAQVLATLARGQAALKVVTDGNGLPSIDNNRAMRLGSYIRTGEDGGLPADTASIVFISCHEQLHMDGEVTAGGKRLAASELTHARMSSSVIFNLTKDNIRITHADCEGYLRLIRQPETGWEKLVA
jgi:hypothetical protein